MRKIHPTAIVHEGAIIGEDVEIGPYCQVGPNVNMGDGCVLKSNVIIEGHTTIGDNNVFFPYSYVGGVPQDFKYAGEDTRLIIGHRNTFREFVSVHLGTVQGGEETVIGDHNLLMGYVHIAHDCRLGNHNILTNYVGLSGHVTLDNHIMLGGQVGVTPSVRIGDFAYIGGASVIDKHLAPYITGYGNRIQIKGVNLVGLKRHGFSRKIISSILDAHRIFFRSDSPDDDSLRLIEDTYGDVEEVRLFVDFIRSVNGGVKK